VSNVKASMIARISAFLFMAIVAPRQAHALPEPEIKAAFIYRFTQFVTWPNDAFDGKDAPFIIATIGDDSLSAALQHAMSGRVVNGRPIVITHFASVDRIEHCHLLFVPASQQGTVPAILAKVGNAPVLTVGDGDGFMQQGGAIRLFVEDGRMKFELDPDVASAARLKPGAQLMKVGQIYQK
jgi:hypothetical protein